MIGPTGPLEIIGQISHIETIATGRGIRSFSNLKEKYGAARWQNARELRRFVSSMALSVAPHSPGTKPMVLGKKASRSNGSSRKATKWSVRKAVFVLCLRNEGCDDLEVRNVYRVMADAAAAAQS
jgi:hypothetical protein